MVPSDAEIAVLTRQVRDNPRSVAFVALADALRKTGRHTEALATLRDGERNRPDHAPARVVLARIHVDLGNVPLAIDVLQDVVRVDPENVAAATLLVRLLVEEGRGDDAAPLVERLRMSGGAEAELAQILDRQSRKAATLPHGSRPFDSPALADQLAARGARRQARAILGRILLDHPDHAALKRRIGELDAELEEAAGAPALARADELPEWETPAPSPAAEALRVFADRVLRYA